MNYCDWASLKNIIAGNKEYGSFLAQAGKEVDDYFSRFSDSPDHISRWAHHYFCKEEGGLLIYDDRSPEAHVCSICGKSYSNDLLNGVWFTMYRNQGAVNAWKSAMIYKVTGQRKYLENITAYAEFYNDNYLKFRLHNKEGHEFDSLDGAEWGCSRIMPQSLNESIFLIRLINALEIVRDDLPDGFILKMEKGIFSEAYTMFKPQVHKIHNIPTWLNCGIGVMGLFLGNQEMIDFAFDGELGVLAQLEQGVTSDGFWYEGSIHYNFFLLEGVVNLMLFSSLYGKEFPLGKGTVDRMLRAAYRYAFDNHQLPNPNDGWPDVNLKTYSHVYATAVKVLGEKSETGKILGSILNQKGERGTVPLSRPYFYNNDISLEELLFTPHIRRINSEILKRDTVNFTSSYCANIKAYGSNIFLKYGHNGPSHAHPDKMSVEVLLKGVVLSRDLSNSGYGNPLCNEWHRVSASHNTVVVNGESHTGFDGGRCLVEAKDHMKVSASGVYEGVDYTREITIEEKGFRDLFDVNGTGEKVCDYIFHVEGSIASDLSTEKGSLGFSENGYQHFSDVRKVIAPDGVFSIDWTVKGLSVRSEIDIKDSELFVMKSPDNPVVDHRTSFILRQKTNRAHFSVNWILPD